MPKALEAFLKLTSHGTVSPGTLENLLALSGSLSAVSFRTRPSTGRGLGVRRDRAGPLCPQATLVGLQQPRAGFRNPVFGNGAPATGRRPAQPVWPTARRALSEPREVVGSNSLCGFETFLAAEPVCQTSPFVEPHRVTPVPAELLCGGTPSLGPGLRAHRTRTPTASAPPRTPPD